jgi:transposase InsO family protein
MGKKDKKRRVYPEEFKAEAAALAEKREKPVIQAARDLGISGTALHKWMKQSREAGREGLPPFPGHGRPPVTAYRFMRANRERHTVREMAGLFGVSCGAYYKWARYGVSERRSKADAELAALIRDIVLKHHRRYGSPRVREEPRGVYGKRVSLKKAARLMREQGLHAKRRRKYISATNSNRGLAVCENILDRQFDALKPGEKWVSDITYLRTSGSWVYLTMILDLYDRKAIGWALSGDMESEHTVIPALEMAVANRAPSPGLIFHSGRGARYCSKRFRGLPRLRCPAVRQGMSRKGNCWDNACAESFFKTLKGELETLEGRHCAAEVRQSVFMYIEAYYNRARLHSALDYAARPRLGRRRRCRGPEIVHVAVDDNGVVVGYRGILRRRQNGRKNHA